MMTNEKHARRASICAIPSLATVLAVCGALVAACHGQSEENIPPKKPVPAQAEPGEKPGATDGKPLSSGNEEIDRLLDRLEAKGRAIKGLKSDLVYTYVTVDPVEDRQVKKGTVRFARGAPNDRFRVHFTELIAGGVKLSQGEFFVFDGQWLVERNDKAKTVIRREIVRKGEHINPFELGKGPFPLPFGQKREEILRRFKVRLKPLDVGDPPGTKHLHCVPLPNTDLAERYSRVEIFIDPSIDLPVRIAIERVVDGNRIEVDFKGIDTQEAPAGSWFHLDVPAGYHETVEPLSPAIKTDGD